MGLYPKFRWPRARATSIEFGPTAGSSATSRARNAPGESTSSAFGEHRRKIAALIIIEPMQGEGGDNHFRPEFLASLRAYADEERPCSSSTVQTGFYGSGSAWLWQRLGVAPGRGRVRQEDADCAGSTRAGGVDEVAGNVFGTPGRINSTWGAT
ncbi:MAG: aminotransferase class III-fold pyridoxal phosphate-dependent enzyme [Phycisphaerales bacterium]